MNRRSFLKAVALAAFASREFDFNLLSADETVALDPNIVAVFSDVHLYAPETVQQVVRFKMCVAKVLAMNPRPANLLIYGDVAYDAGKVENYELFKKLIKPIEDVGIKWEVAMGNHDRLADYRQVFPERFEKKANVEGRYVNVVETPRADFIMLDSYLKDQVRGEISPEQQEWLVEELKKYASKPVFVGCHHPLYETKIQDVLKACPSFVAYLHGHSHYYRTPIFEDVQTLCFPSVGHWGDMGFTTIGLSEKEAFFAPDIDAYLWSKYGRIKEPEKDVDAYMKALNEHTLTLNFPNA